MKSFLLALVSLWVLSATPVFAQPAASHLGNGPIECDCNCIIQVRGESAPRTSSVKARGDSIASIDGGVCQTACNMANEAMITSGVDVQDFNFSVPPDSCHDLADEARGAASTGAATPSRSDYSPASFGYVNPLGTTSVPQLIGNLIRSLLGVVGAVFLVMFVYGGVLWSTAGGDPKRVQSAKTALINAVTGMIIIAFSYAIVSLILTFAGQVVAS